MLLLLCAILLSSIIYLFLVKPNAYWRNKCIRYVQPSILFGNMVRMAFQRENFAAFAMRIYNKYKNDRYVGVFQFTRPILFVRDLELVKQIAIKESDSFEDHQPFSREDIDPLWTRTLLASRGEQWRQMRTTLSPSFTSSKMKMMYGLVIECADRFVKFYADKDMDSVQELEMKDAFTRFTNDAIATSAFGVTCDSLREPNNEFYLKGLDATNFRGIRGLKFLIYPLSPALIKFLNIKIINTDVGNFFQTIIRDTIAMREKENIVRPDMVQLMMELRNKIGADKLSDLDITAQALIFYLAGFETSSLLMCFVAYALAANPELQEKLRCEIVDTLKAHDGELTYDALMSMKYLDMFVNGNFPPNKSVPETITSAIDEGFKIFPNLEVLSETLRMWPPTPLTDRTLTKENYIIPPERPNEVGLELKKGDICWIPVHAFHHDPTYFPDPEKFNPDRFSEENKHQMQNAFLPFGLGPRNCIGSRFATMETKAIISKLVQKFEIVPIARTHIPMVLDQTQFSTYSAGGWWLGLKKRSNI